MSFTKDLPTSLIAAAPSPSTSGTSLIVTTTEGSFFDTPSFYATVSPQNAPATMNNSEIVLVTVISTDTFTITRAQKGTTAQSIGVGWRISRGVYAADFAGFEEIANKATDFTTVNNTLYPTVQAVNNAIITATVGLLDYRGSYNASTNLFPASGGSGLVGAILKGDFWITSVSGTLGGIAVTPGDLIISTVDTPGQTSTNWDLIAHNLGSYVTLVTGTTNRITSSGGATPAIDISASYVGQSSITTLGTIATGVWSGTTIAVLKGGTGVTTSTGAGNNVLSTSPTLVTPALGTPSALVGTNITGTGASFTAGTATVANGLKSATTTVSVSGATAPTTGQVLTATAGTTATWQTPSGGGGGITWTNVTGTSQTASVNNGYIANNAGLVTITLPSTAAVGSIVEVAGAGAGGFKVSQNASQLIHFGTATTTTGTGGSLASVNQYDALRLICSTANTTWSVISSVGNVSVT